MLLSATLRARAAPANRGGGGEPKAGKEAGKILAKALRGLATGSAARTMAAAAATTLRRTTAEEEE